MASNNFYALFFFGTNHDEEGMVKPYNSYVFFPEINAQNGFTEVKVCAANVDTTVPAELSIYVSKSTKVEDVCEEVFDKLKALPENKGLKYRKFF